MASGELRGEFGGKHASEWPEDLKVEFEEALLKPGTYLGMKTGHTDNGEGTFCRKESSYHVAWQATLGDFRADMDDAGVLKIHLEFDATALDVSGFRKGGVLCTWQGGAGRLTAHNVEVDFTLEPMGEDEVPRIDVGSVQLHGLNLDRVAVAVPFFTIQNGTAPDWAIEMAEKNFNKYVPKFLESSLGKRFDAYLSKRLKTFLDRARADGFIGF